MGTEVINVDETPHHESLAEELAGMCEPAAALVVALAADPVPGVRVVAVARDEAHVFLTAVSYTADEVGNLITTFAGQGADEVDWEDDHLRLWWD